MKYYLAPLEGITGYIYRNAYHGLFTPMDKYFTPFIVPNQSKSLKSRELNDISPEHNKGLNIIPQILTNKSEDFLCGVQKLKQLGYEEVNFNLGCPSGTVVAKGRGSGFLARKEELNRFFDAVFSQADLKISVKTRIGKDSPDEFYELIEIFNQYPMEELIIHPRCQVDYYKNKPNLKVFEDAIRLSKNKICYNGDINTVSDFKSLTDSFPELDRVMLGRGIISNPALVGIITDSKYPEKQQLREFHDRICNGYIEIMSGDRNVLFKMKEFWFYMIHLFTNSSKYMKKIRKTEKVKDYESVIDALFLNEDIHFENGDNLSESEDIIMEKNNK